MQSLLEQGNLPNLVKGTSTHGEYCRYTNTTYTLEKDNQCYVESRF